VRQRDRKADKRVANLEAQGDEDRAADDAERDEPVGARVVSVGHERGAVESPAGAESNEGSDLVSDEADDSGNRGGAYVGEVLRGTRRSIVAPFAGLSWS
jgi:hypothetical protein